MHLTNFEFTITVLGAVYAAICIGFWLDLHRRYARAGRAREAFQRAQDTIPQPPWTQQDADNDVDSMIYAIREEPACAAGRERIATPADQPDNPGLFLPAELDDLEQWRAELAEGSGL